MSLGKILVFDLDETLISSKPAGAITVNPNTLMRIHKAVQLRNANKSVDAILLLTNNMNLIEKTFGTKTITYASGFVIECLTHIVLEFNKISAAMGLPTVSEASAIFDKVYTAEKRFINSGQRVKHGFEPAKNIATIINMINEINAEKGKNISTENLPTRVFFFDDYPHHSLRKELDRKGYIVIDPPFGTGANITNFKAVNAALVGGTRRNKRRLRKTRSKRR